MTFWSKKLNIIVHHKESGKTKKNTLFHQHEFNDETQIKKKNYSLDKSHIDNLQYWGTPRPVREGIIPPHSWHWRWIVLGSHWNPPTTVTIMKDNSMSMMKLKKWRTSQIRHFFYYFVLTSHLTHCKESQQNYNSKLEVPTQTKFKSFLGLGIIKKKRK